MLVVTGIICSSMYGRVKLYRPRKSKLRRLTSITTTIEKHIISIVIALPLARKGNTG